MNDAVLLQNGQTPLSIAQQLGYISVVEILKNVTTVSVATPTIDEKYKVVFPEMMQEAPIDSDEEGGELRYIVAYFSIFLWSALFLSDDLMKQL